MIEKYKNRKTRAGTEQPDLRGDGGECRSERGAVMETLKRLGLEENTLVIFTSDNGGLSVEEGANTPATSNARCGGRAFCTRAESGSPLSLSFRE